MYRVVLISTGKNVTESFNSLDLWEKQGFVLNDVVLNIDDALKLSPDVLICPASSSYMDLEDVCAKIKSSDLSVCLVMYGRKTYEHAKNAIDCGSVGYIAMPPEKSELTHSLIKTKETLDAMATNEERSNVFSDINDTQEMAIYSIVYGVYNTKSDFEDLFKSLSSDIVCSEFEYQLIKISIKDIEQYIAENWKHGKELLYTAIRNFIKKTDEQFFIYPINISDNNVYALAFKKNGEDINCDLNDIKNNVADILKLKIEFYSLKSGNVYSIMDSETRNDIITLSELTLNSDNAKNFTYTDEEKIAITNAKNYINKSYGYEISLNDVARYVGLSSAYFSRLFKQETDENFIDYLIKVRMENAKTYLQNPAYKTYEVSEMVGYTKSKYFSKLFKNYTGYTPTEYRTKMLRKRSDI